MIYKISLVLAVGLTLVYAFQSFYPEFMSPFSNALFPFISGAVAISAIFALRRYRSGSNEFSLVWFCFTAGMLLWFLGETGWAFYTFVLGTEIPYPSIADVFWLGGYIPLLIALYLYVKMFASALSRRILGTVMAATLITAILVTIALINPVVGTDEDLITLITDFAYPLLDLVLFSMALLGLAVFQKGSLGKSWILITAGIILNTAGDFLFGYTTAQNTYYNGHPSELLFVWGYIVFTLAFYSHTKEL